MNDNNKNAYGQYMTPYEIAEFMASLIGKDQNSKILEPSSGEGVFIEVLKKRGYKDITAYEIDKNISRIKDVIFQSFVSAEILEKFDVVIGNPPYIRWKNLEIELKEELEKNHLYNSYLNNMIDYSAIFIVKSIEQLKQGGELIFITPDYWLNTTHSLRLRDYILTNGEIREIYSFNEAPIFKGVSVSLMVFKFTKGFSSNNRVKISKLKTFKKPTDENLKSMLNFENNSDVQSFESNQFQKSKNWLLANDHELQKLQIFEYACKVKSNKKYEVLDDYCEIGNGMVSGLDKAFQVDYKLNELEKINTIKVLKAKDLEQFFYKKTTSYIYIQDHLNENDFQLKFPNFYRNLSLYIDQLKKRYNYGRDINYWEWVFLRNQNLFSQKVSKIFIPCKERISAKNYFRFSLVPENIYPTQDVTGIIPKPETKESIQYILGFLNTNYVFNWLKFKGIIKGNIVEFSRKPLATLPFRSIDFSNIKEVEIHNQITESVNDYLNNKNQVILDTINSYFDVLMQSR